MSNHIASIQHFLNSHGISHSAVEFVEIVSNIYHKYESGHYDRQQQSIHSSSKSWMRALAGIIDLGPGIRVLDYGTGTGFATSQVLMSAMGPLVDEIVCYDLSPDMIAQAKKKLSKFDSARFLFLSGQDGREYIRQRGPYNLVVTNALLHHLIDVEGFLKQVSSWISPSGFYIAGHEPNMRFYQNKELIGATRSFQQYKKFKMRLTAKYWLHKLGIRVSFHDLALSTNNELIAKGYIREPISPGLLHKLVDIHVPFGLSLDQPWGEIGFSPEFFLKHLGSDFQYQKVFTYSHIKDAMAIKDRLWRSKLRKLEIKYPDDGADALAVFRKS